MKRNQAVVLPLLALSIGLSGCDLVQPKGPPPPPFVSFTGTPGSPAFEPSRSLQAYFVGATPPPGIIVQSQSAIASKTVPSPTTPHIKIGDAVVKPADGETLSLVKMRHAIEEEARAHGATAVVYVHCDPALECAASFFRLAKDVDPSLRPKAAPAPDEEQDEPTMRTNAAHSMDSNDGPSADFVEPTGPAPDTVLADTVEGAPATDAWLADNRALGKALVGLWTPNAKGEIPDSATDTFEKELLKSRLYINAGKKDPPKHEGNLIVYTDSNSLVAVDGKGAKPYGLPCGEIFQLALDMKLGVYLHYEGSASVFTTLDADRLKKLLLKLPKPAKKKK
ncbi:MAG: hypothetical protein U0441_00230 [Polyangiaceae bacterium]